VLFGHDIVASRAIPTADPYSFTSDRPWVNHEWLSESLMYGAYALSGPIGLGVLKLALVLSILGLVLVNLRTFDSAPLLHDGLVFLTLVGIAPQSGHMRPEMFSLVLFAAMLTMFTAAEHGAMRALWAVPALMIAWVNCHGGWLVGIGALGVWIAGELLASWSLRNLVRLGALGATAAVATLANPYGVGLWRFLRETVGLDRRDISEWLPVYQLGPGIALLWLIAAAVAFAAVFLSGRQPRASAVLVIAMLAVASFRVGRLIGFFALAVVILLGPAVSVAWNRRAARASVPKAPTRAEAVIVAAIAVGVLSWSAIQIDGNLKCIRIEPDWSPEPAAAQFIEGNGLHGRMLTWFDYGEYAIWHFWPAIRVSIDGRRETVYSDAVRERHLAFFFDAPRGRQYATELNADYVWVPRWLPSVRSLREEGWTMIFAGSKSVIFTRRRVAINPPPLDTQANASCFPGP
jgi:hypothetical protein